jgi:hypothetical protein
MPDFRLASNGYVNAALSDGDLASLFRNLRLLRIDSYNDFEIVMKGYVAIETLRDVNLITGGNFAKFLEANYDSGRGPMAVLAKDILHYLNGKVGVQSLLSQIRIQEHTLQAAAKRRAATYGPIHRAGSSVPFIEKGYRLDDYDLYRLAAGIGPAALGRLFLLLGGENYYG